MLEVRCIVQDIFANVLAEAGEGRETDAMARPPGIDEVQECIKALRAGAAPGIDMVDGRLLKAGGQVVVAWMHRIISLVWRSGTAPQQWKEAMILPLYKGKGPRDVFSSYRGISLTSIVGKVYALLLLHRVGAHLDQRLLEAQSGFRVGRGTIDAMFTLQALKGACRDAKKRMVVAFVDFTKAYDCINRIALWKILHTYGVHPKIISLLRDLHTGTSAAVRLGGELGRSFLVTAGVRQGCVIAPTLFNVFIDHVLRAALARMPPEVSCGIQIRPRVGGKITEPNDGDVLVERLAFLLYADDLALISHDRSALIALLNMVDVVSQEHGLHINAAKTEIVNFNSDVAGDGANTHPVISVAGGSVTESDEFRYLGAYQCATQGSAKEIDHRNARVLATMGSLNGIWSSNMSLSAKMRVYKVFVLPHFTYGCEAWSATQVETTKLAHTHNHCLRRILGVKLAERRTLASIYERCGSEPLEVIIAKSVTKWTGHMMRMDGSRYPRLAFECKVHNAEECIGAAWSTGIRHYYKNLWVSTGFVVPQQYMTHGGNWSARSWQKMWDDLFARAQDRVAWRNAVQDIGVLPVAPPDPTPPRRNPPRDGRGLHATGAGGHT
jgi:hypothetical protein